MRYDQQEEDEDQIYVQRNPVNDFLKVITTPGIPKDAKHKKIFESYAGRDKKTAFVSNPLVLQINCRRRLNLLLALEAGIVDLPEYLAFFNVDDMSVTQGQGGNLLKTAVTRIEKHELRNTTHQKKGMFSNIIKRDREGPEEQVF